MEREFRRESAAAVAIHLEVEKAEAEFPEVWIDVREEVCLGGDRPVKLCLDRQAEHSSVSQDLFRARAGRRGRHRPCRP